MSWINWVIGEGVAKFLGRLMTTKNSIHGLVVAALAAATSITFTADQILGGMIRYDPSGGTSNATMPTAALLIAAIGDKAEVGMSFDFDLVHSGSTSEVVTLVAGTGNTLLPATIAFDGLEAVRMRALLTNVTAASEAVTYYSLGLSLLTT